MQNVQNLRIILEKEVKTADPAEIDRVVQEMVLASKNNHKEIAELALECSAALSSAEARTSAMSSRGFFKRNWDKLTGKDDRLRSAIARDQVAAQYALQQTINCIVHQCNQNQELSLLIKQKFEGEIIRLEERQLDQSRETLQIRKFLVAFYNGYVNRVAKLEEAYQQQAAHAARRCEYCREAIEPEQIICSHCGKLQELKLNRLPATTQNNLKNLSALVEMPLNQWNPDIHWNKAVERYVAAMRKSERIATMSGLVDQHGQLKKDMDALIHKCSTPEFQIAVVGILKAGKSMLMNALIGEELAPTGLNSKTAALTKFRSSSKGNYVRVTFYSAAEWNKLQQSARISRDTRRSEGTDSEEMTLKQKLSQSTVQEDAKRWIGHEPIVEYFTDDQQFRQAIERWTAADSNDHLFAAEVEVGISKEKFNMPEEVVFVDTPGLHDPVQYRSRITEEYIGKANAVLVALRAAAMSTEAFEVVTTVLDHAGTNKNKVFIIGTQKDLTNSVNDSDEYVFGEGGWVEHLVNAGRYKNTREASSRILTTSAYLHLCLSRMLKLTPTQLVDPAYFSDNDYNNLERSVKQVLHVRSYDLINIGENTKYSDKNQVFAYAGINQLKERLQTELINKYRTLKADDIRTDYIHCKDAILRSAQKSVERSLEMLNATQATTEERQKMLSSAEKERERLDAEREKIQNALNTLSRFTKKRLAEINTRPSDSKKGGKY